MITINPFLKFHVFPQSSVDCVASQSSVYIAWYIYKLLDICQYLSLLNLINLSIYLPKYGDGCRHYTVNSYYLV